MAKWLMILMSGLWVCGCESQQSANPRFLPEGAAVAEQLGHGWVVFQLNIQGKEHRFLYHRAQTYNGDNTYEAITELSR